MKILQSEKVNILPIYKRRRRLRKGNSTSGTRFKWGVSGSSNTVYHWWKPRSRISEQVLLLKLVRIRNRGVAFCHPRRRWTYHKVEIPRKILKILEDGRKPSYYMCGIGSHMRIQYPHFKPHKWKRKKIAIWNIMRTWNIAKRWMRVSEKGEAGVDLKRR